MHLHAYVYMCIRVHERVRISLQPGIYLNESVQWYEYVKPLSYKSICICISKFLFTLDLIVFIFNFLTL